MTESDETCWTMVLAAARGDAPARQAFALLYMDIVRAYLGSRWRGRPLQRRTEDAVQDVFFECFRQGGALDRLERDGDATFRTFLYSIVRNVARRFEERRGEGVATTALGEEAGLLPAMGPTPSVAFDQAWARSMVARARERQRREAEAAGPTSLRRIELLDLRLGEDLPIREIAARWQEDAAVLHAEYRQARADFQRALRTEVSFQGVRGEAAIEKECLRLLSLLGGAA
jgi:DNA-directed RNA polymerase specialized sigma24 family protein